MTKIHLTIQGKVQGVGFRYYAQQQAQRLGVVGWVRNLPDGRVEVLAQGDEEQLQKFLIWCHKGPSLASVLEVKKKRAEPTKKFIGFKIK